MSHPSTIALRAAIEIVGVSAFRKQHAKLTGRKLSESTVARYQRGYQNGVPQAVKTTVQTVIASACK